MLAHSQAFHRALLEGAPMFTKAWVQRAGRTVFGPAGVFLDQAKIDFDEFAASRRVLSAKIADVDGLLRPRFATNTFAPFGNELVVTAGPQVSPGVVEYAQLGVFRLLATTTDTTGWLTVTGFDRAYVVASQGNEAPYVIPSGTTLASAMSEYLQAKYPGIEFLYDGAAAAEIIGTTIVYEEGDSSGNPWANMSDLALEFGREFFIDAFGRAIMRPVVTQIGAPYAAIYSPGEMNVIIGASVILDARGVKNVVKLVAESSALSATITSTAEVTDLSDPLYAGVGSTVGRLVEHVQSSTVTSQDQADMATAAILAQKKGVSENITLQIAPILVHEPGDVVAGTSDRESITGVFALSRWSLDLSMKSTMNVATRILRQPETANIPLQRARAGVATGAGVSTSAVGQVGRQVFPTAATGAGSAGQGTTNGSTAAGVAIGVGSAGDAHISRVEALPALSVGAGQAPTTKVNVKPGSLSDAGAANNPAASMAPHAGAGAGSATAFAATVATGPTVVASAEAPGADGEDTTVTFGGGHSATAGNKLVLRVTREKGSFGAICITPSGYTLITQSVTPDGVERAVGFFMKEAAGGETGVTIGGFGDAILDVHLEEWSGLLDANTADKVDGNSSGGATTRQESSGTTATTTQASEVWFAMWRIAGAPFGVTPTLTNGFVSVTSTASARSLFANKVVTSTGIAESTADWQVSGGIFGYTEAIIVCVKAA